jgi:Domain of unknown function (DUF4440)
MFPGCTVWNDRPAKTFTDATGGEGLERVFWRELKAQRWNEVERSLASNFVSVTPSGPRDRVATIEHLKQLRLQDYSLGEFQTELNGNTIVVTYTVTVHGTSNGQPLPEGPMHMMTVWQEQKAGWVVIARSIVPPETK